MSRTGHYRHEQKARIISKRIAQYRRLTQHAETLEYREAEGQMQPGYFENEQPHLGCRRAHCGMCHFEKQDPARRDREKREWRKQEGLL